MSKYVKWRDRSYQTSGGKWVPEAIADVIEGSNVQHELVRLSDADHEKVKRGEVMFSTAEQAKAAAYEMVKRLAWNKYGIPEERIQEH
jgi:hypothetical protein